ncbi:NUDIX domain-containing protein [Clostridium sp. C8-1-8]|uniref:NUDIX domain-containing protein n=1 Tax=Clostridium sp. C8-1-8 TaxID=2698831 RepID=UPI001371C564|nr:NUDIX domain-containing protein [Clostridium sp. C8-1-8]
MKNEHIEVEENVFGEKLYGVEYTDRIGVYGITFNKEGKVGTIKKIDKYFLPGGGLEVNEDYEQCVKREFIEETGYEISIKSYIGEAILYHESRTKRKLKGIGHFYIVDLLNFTDKKVEEDHELIWLDPEECIKMLLLEYHSWAVRQAVSLEFENRI